jgi:hypothetical protein
MNFKNIFLAVAAIASLGLAACSEVSAPTAPVKQTQAAKAAAAANSITFSENAEIENIQRRLELTSNPGQIGFVLLMNEMGQPVAYMSVKGKITSGSKRLTSPESVIRGDFCGEYNCARIGVAPSDEGTYGTSGEYIYFWTNDGQYVQWNGKYLYSDKPLRTSVPPLVIASN